MSELCLGIKLAVKLLQSSPKHLYLESFLTPIFSTSLRFHYHWIFILIQNIAVHRFLGHCSWTAQDSYKFNSFYKPSSISQLLPISIKTTKLIIPKDNTNAANNYLMLACCWCWSRCCFELIEWKRLSLFFAADNQEPLSLSLMRLFLFRRSDQMRQIRQSHSIFIQMVQFFGRDPRY